MNIFLCETLQMKLKLNQSNIENSGVDRKIAMGIDKVKSDINNLTRKNEILTIVKSK